MRTNYNYKNLTSHWSARQAVQGTSLHKALGQDGLASHSVFAFVRQASHISSLTLKQLIGLPCPHTSTSNSGASAKSYSLAAITLSNLKSLFDEFGANILYSKS